MDFPSQLPDPKKRLTPQLIIQRTNLRRQRTRKRIKRIKEIGAYIFLFLLVFSGVFLIVGILATDFFVKRFGVCTRGVLINKMTGDRTTASMLYYQVVINHHEYTGNSQETDVSKVGDSICVIYLEAIPFLNRAVKYFDEHDLKCKCN